uniref:Uncharacterized protein n=1 Tax=Arundo donax TaxID=35708 RepID=A0A0A9C1H4_ARUDO
MWASARLDPLREGRMVLAFWALVGVSWAKCSLTNDVQERNRRKTPATERFVLLRSSPPWLRFEELRPAMGRG